MHIQINTAFIQTGVWWQMQIKKSGLMNELRVARGGLLPDLSRGFLFWGGGGWVKCFNSFHAVDTCMCLFMQDQQFKEWYDFPISLFFQ